MKLSEFWIDLPMAICNISKEITTNEELEVCNIIISSSKNFSQIYENFLNNYKNITFELSEAEKEMIKKKLENIMIEKAEITCRSIKFCVKIMSRLLKYISEEKDKNTNVPNLLLKNKLFLKITKLIIENANESLKCENAPAKQKEFFSM